MIVVRAARRGEEDALGASAQAAFKTPDPDAFTRYFHEHTARAPADTLVAEVDGALAGHATALRLTMRLRDADVPFRGLSAVAVLPEHRQAGVAARLLREHLRRQRARREPLSLLYPFSVPFYQRHGWGVVEWVDEVRVPPRALPRSPLRRRVRRLDARADGVALRATYEEARRAACGLLVRDEHWWERRVLGRVPERVAYVDEAGALAGYLLYEVPAEPAFPRQHVLVRELVARTPEASQGLVGFLAALGDQFSLVEIVLPRGAGATLPGHPALVTRDAHALYHPAVTTLSGAMGRLVLVPEAFAAHPGATGGRGRLGLEVADPLLGRTLSYDVTLSARGVHAAPGRTVKERLVLSIDRLSQVYFAAASARLLWEQGHLAGDRGAAERLDAAFAGPPLHLGRMNFF